MFNKFIINNELIGMKKEIEKVSLFLTRKCIKSIKNLNKILETKKKNEKLEKQSAKLINELEILKHLNFMEIAKYALTTKDPKKLLTSFKSTPTERIYAKICMQKAIVDSVKEIRTKYNLDEDENWEEKLLELGKKKQQKLGKLPKTKGKKKEKKESESVDSEDNEETKQSDDDDENKETVNESASESNNNTDVESNNDDDGEDVNEETELPKKIVKKASPKIVVKKQKKDKKSKKSLPEIDEINPPAKVINRKNDSSLNKFSEAPKPNIIKSVDSFFMTNSGENYVATIVNPPPTDESNNNNNTENNQEHESTNNYSYMKNRKQNLEPRFKERRIENNFKRKDFDYTESKMNKRFKEEEQLHPSWAAKQKMKPIIASFQGKKTTFDSDAKPSYTPPTNNFVQKFNKPVEPEPGLHPSWAAKQKLKPVIGDFKGIKIKFDD